MTPPKKGSKKRPFGRFVFLEHVGYTRLAQYGTPLVPMDGDDSEALDEGFEQTPSWASRATQP